MKFLEYSFGKIHIIVFIQFKIIDMILKFVLDFAHLLFDFSESIFIFGMEF